MQSLLLYLVYSDLAEATCRELRERLDRANEERDSALQQAQNLSDRLSRKETQVEELRDNAVKAHNQIQTLEEQLEDVTRRLVGKWHQ